MTVTHSIQFGYYPKPLDLLSGEIAIATLPHLSQTVADIESSREVDQNWIYAPPQFVQQLGGCMYQRPYPARIFGLPKTHVITHTSSDDANHLIFHLWALSFFTGMRLTSTDAGFIDTTPLKPGSLVDFVIPEKGLIDAIKLVEAFWVMHRSEPEKSQLFAAAVHALFLGQNPRHLQFESFLLFYTSIDACFALAKALKSHREYITHAERINWMCSLFEIPIPDWANPAPPTGAAVASLRNETVHEALFMNEPLGFAIHGSGANRNLTLEMRALICRLLVALLGGDRTDYVVSPINVRQRHRLNLVTP